MTSRPEPSSPAASKRMKQVRQKDTDVELAVRRILFRRGLRYRINYRVSPRSRSRADIFFTKYKLAVFIDGCFWHACPEHGTLPTSNQAWWMNKLETNVARDRQVNTVLRVDGLRVVRFWAHEDPVAVADAVEACLDELRERMMR